MSNSFRGFNTIYFPLVFSYLSSSMSIKYDFVYTYETKRCSYYSKKLALCSQIWLRNSFAEQILVHCLQVNFIHFNDCCIIWTEDKPATDMFASKSSFILLTNDNNDDDKKKVASDVSFRFFKP